MLVMILFLFQDFLEQEKNNNEELEKQINLCERQLAKCRLDYQERETVKFQLRDEVRDIHAYTHCVLTYDLFLQH